MLNAPLPGQDVSSAPLWGDDEEGADFMASMQALGGGD